VSVSSCKKIVAQCFTSYLASPPSNDAVKENEAIIDPHYMRQLIIHGMRVANPDAPADYVFDFPMEEAEVCTLSTYNFYPLMCLLLALGLGTQDRSKFFNSDLKGPIHHLKQRNSCPSLHRRFFPPKYRTPLFFSFFLFVSVSSHCYVITLQSNRPIAKEHITFVERAQRLLCYVLCKNTPNMYELACFSSLLFLLLFFRLTRFIS